MDSLRDTLGTAFSLLYVASPLLTVILLGLVGLLALPAPVVAVVAALRGHRRVAWAAAAVAVLAVVPAVFTLGMVNNVAWPGRFAPVSAADVAGRYSLLGLELRIELAADGTYAVAGAAWLPVSRSGRWRVAPLEEWGPAGQAGHVVLTEDGGAEHWVALARPTALLLGSQHLTPAAYASLRRAQQEAHGYQSDYQRVPRLDP